MTTWTEQVSEEVVTRAPRARCHECGDDDIVALCCNCGAFVCGRHDRVADLQEVRRVVESVVRRGVHLGRDASDVLDRIPAAGEAQVEPEPEGRDRTDGPAPAAADAATEPKAVLRRHFCADCVPVGHALDVQVLGALVVGLLGSALLALSVPTGALVIVGSAGWLGLRITTGLVRRRRRGPVDRRLLFLAPRIRKMELTETVEGRCELAADRRESLVVDEVRGSIDVGLRWTANHAMAADRHRQRARPERRSTLRAEAGHLVLRGAGQRDLAHPAGCEVNHPARVTLRPWLTDHQVLTHPDGRGDARWDFTVEYKPEEPAAGWRLPVWVTPSLTPDSDRRALDLRVQWRTTDPVADPEDGPELTAKELTSVVLNVPGAWGVVQHATLDDVEQTVLGRNSDGTTRVEWKKARITKTGRGSRELSVSFARPVDSSATVTGDVEIAFGEAASGITGVQMHAPGGERRRDGIRPKIKTKVRVHFELSLSGIRYQESRTVPDAAVDSGATTESRTFPGTRPDQHLIVGLVGQLSEQRYLVKSVVEHPPRPGRGVGLQYRVWDVTGRRYRGVHPIDFRVTVAGDEAESGATSPSTTSIRLIVRAVHASTEMEAEIRKAYEEIWARITSAVEAAGTGADGNTPRRQSEPIAAIGAHAAHLQGTLLSIESLLGEAEREGRISTEFADELHELLESVGEAGA
jgi:hypothetical protein